MSASLETYNRILFLDLRPWLLSGFSELKFKQDLQDLKKAFYQVQPLYEVSFPKALTNKRKYFLSLIDAEALEYLNYIHKQVSESINTNAKKYHVHMALTRTLNEKLRETAQAIQEQEYSPNQYDPTFGVLPTDTSIADGAYILFYLKHQLVRLYLEIQDSYPELLKEEPLTEDDIYLTYFNHTAPNPSHVSEAVPIQIASPSNPKAIAQAAKTFKALTNDFRDTSKGILSYDAIIKNPTRFASFEESLFQNGYIDENYKFVDKHGMKNEMAAIYHQLINKGYFHQRTFQPTKQIKDVDIRKFLDHRYQANLDKQFRTYRQNPDQLAEYIDSQYWLTKLPLG
ncbi:DUF6617 family protein [Algoriphagus pacificus]|jgi:hypothetical protein|uniref:Uncharacterized protein n=1 Tax=Algoriphagus pacificus TaxID=2811234 RepID=A0ABS3CIB7_9BACT|nr:DUF6617 family protein [Algoriphagus pacificus]MBN7816846.1 hypothetical protein [Algoriphagus pacificus]